MTCQVLAIVKTHLTSLINAYLFSGFDLGVRQAGQKVWDVGLPSWCPENNPRLFTMIHRQALESECASQHLANWVDLVFGFKQTGRPAIDAVNVFHPAVSNLDKLFRNPVYVTYLCKLFMI